MSGAVPVVRELTGALGILGPAAVKAACLLLAGWIVARLVGRQSAAVKHLVWLAALGACLLLPAAEAALPDLVTMSGGPLAAAAAEAVRSAAELMGAGDPAGALATGEGVVPAAGAGGSPAPLTRASGPLGSIGAWGALAVAAALVWLVGTLWVLARTAWGLHRLAGIRRRARPLEEIGGVTESRLRRRAAEPALQVRVSPEVSIPVVQGIFRPTLLLPRHALDEWPADRIRAVLLHEAGHVARRDFSSHLVARLACALYWFNPFVWWAAGELRKAQERACDDAVLRAGHRPSSYARHLLSIAREGGGSSVQAGVSMAHWADLEGRVLALLREDVDRRPARGSWLAGITVPALAVVLVLGAVSFTTAEAVAPDGEEAAAHRTGGAAEREVRPELSELIAALGHPSAPVRKEAVRGLAELEDPSAVPALERVMLADDSRRIRRAAAWAIGESESEEAVEALRRGLDATGDPGLRRAIVRALGETERPGAVPLLSELLDRRDRKTRWRALEALTENGTEPARAAFHRILSGDDPELREMAHRVLEKRRDRGPERKDGERRSGERHPG